MKAIISFIVRQSSIAAFLCSGFAFLQGCRVAEGIWQGSGLHGYVIELGKAHSGQVVSVWASFLNMLTAIGLAGLFGLIATRKNGGLSIGVGMGTLQSGNAGIVESPGRDTVLRTGRKRKIKPR